jgi:hypothetical protein
LKQLESSSGLSATEDKRLRIKLTEKLVAAVSRSTASSSGGGGAGGTLGYVCPFLPEAKNVENLEM